MRTLDLERNFFGRKPILQLLKRRVIDLKEGYRQNIAFVGTRFVGKSSVLQRFVSDLDDDDVIAIYLDLDNKDFNYLFRKFVGSLLYNFSKTKKLSPHAEIHLLLESVRPYLPQTVKRIETIQEVAQKGKTPEAYRELISLPETFTTESGKFCVIILDEFHNLDNLGIPNVFAELGKKIMMQKRCFYLVTSSFPHTAKKILSEKLSLLFGNFETIQIDPFEPEASQVFIADNLKNIKINTQLRNFLTDFTGGYPLYINLICQELLNLSASHNQKEVFTPLLIQAIENTVLSRWGLLSRHFELMVENLCQGKGNRVMACVLISLANGNHKIKELAADAGLKQSLLNQKLNKLAEAGIVVKNGNIYHFDDKLLKYWIKYIFQKRLKAVDLLPEDMRKHLREELSQAIEEFKTVFKKDLSTRIVELLNCFDNEALKLNGRKYKLPLFGEIKPMRIKGRYELIQASSPDGTWFLALKQDTLYVDDVVAFINESKKLEHKPQRRVIISLADLDENARLKALQERMWIWSENELNSLLNFYDKPYIIK